MNIIAALEATGIMVGAVILISLPLWVPYRILMACLSVLGVAAVTVAWYMAYVEFSL